MEIVELNNGVRMPQTGFGVFQITDQVACERAVLGALEAGYRLIDTAACYGNERAVGAAPCQERRCARGSVLGVEGVDPRRRFRAHTGVLRENAFQTWAPTTWTSTLFICRTATTTAAGAPWRSCWHRAACAPSACATSCPTACSTSCCPIAWRPPSIRWSCTRSASSVFCVRSWMTSACAPMAWAPFAEGREGLFAHPELAAVGRPYGKTPAQVVLRWLLQEGIAAIPKSVHRGAHRSKHRHR